LSDSNNNTEEFLFIHPDEAVDYYFYKLETNSTELHIIKIHVLIPALPSSEIASS
jgi:hypothetical protein